MEIPELIPHFNRGENEVLRGDRLERLEPRVGGRGREAPVVWEQVEGEIRQGGAT